MKMDTNKQNIYIIMGIVGIVSLISAGILFSQKGGSQGTASVIDKAQFKFENAVGKKAPEFTLSDIDGNPVSLSALAGKNVVLFFNEGLMCYPACLDQVVQLSSDERLNNENTVAFSIVADSSSNWRKAQKDLPYLTGAKVLFDAGAKVSRAYDTLRLSSSMHKGFYPGHTYFIIDKGGIVRFVLDDPYMGIRNEELAKEIEKLK